MDSRVCWVEVTVVGGQVVKEYAREENEVYGALEQGDTRFCDFA